ncbi:MAG TPA: PEGA domain-containing protein [Pirellulales bacterium]|nr:PEGA domain-containing protein [Pirellulales bacterium]
MSRSPRICDLRAIRVLLAAALSLAALAGAGCVQRRLTIRSNPPGALVYVDNYEIGTTPISTDYIYYGARKIVLVKDGYETLTVKKSLWPPWYDLFPLDFVTENLLPLEIRDERGLDFEMKPMVVVPTEQLLGRAENLRQGTRGGNYTPPPPVKLPTGAVPPQATIVEPR